MTDAALKNAMARRDHMIGELKRIANDINELAEQHARVRANLEEIDDFIRMWHDMAGILPAQPLEQIATEAPVERGKRIRPRNPERGDVARRTVNYIREAGHPLMRKDVMERLKEDGIEIRGKDPAMVLSTMLWRSKDIIRRLKGGGYWPADDPLPKSEIEELIG